MLDTPCPRCIVYGEHKYDIHYRKARAALHGDVSILNPHYEAYQGWPLNIYFDANNLFMHGWYYTADASVKLVHGYEAELATMIDPLKAQHIPYTFAIEATNRFYYLHALVKPPESAVACTLAPGGIDGLAFPVWMHERCITTIPTELVVIPNPKQTVCALSSDPVCYVCEAPLQRLLPGFRIHEALIRAAN